MRQGSKEEKDGRPSGDGNLWQCGWRRCKRGRRVLSIIRLAHQWCIARTVRNRAVSVYKWDVYLWTKTAACAHRLWKRCDR